MRSGLAALLMSALLGAAACSDDDPVARAPSLPDALPFELVRADVGTPLSEAEVVDFTRRVTGFWRDVDYFAWVLRVSHGNDASTGLPEYALWWQDVEAIKAGEHVTFRHNERGGAHNVFIPTPKLLASAGAGYLMTGDPVMGRVVELYAKALTGTMQGMVFDENDSLPYVMARNIITRDHAFTIEGGRSKSVDVSGWYSTYSVWNAERFNYRSNPTWGDIWVTTMRSKDDLPHIFRAVAMLEYVAERGSDEPVRAAAAGTLEHLRGFARDIVEQDYHIRSKDEQGRPFIPDQDLASFSTYDWVIDQPECTAKLSTALIAHDDPIANDCHGGYGGIYEPVATLQHYFNYAIIRHFHLSAIVNALIDGFDAQAFDLLVGLGARLDRYLDPEAYEPGREQERWDGDLAVYALESAAAGLPLTSREARLIHEHFGQAVDDFRAFPNWDLWDPSVPDGVYGPGRRVQAGPEPHYVNVEEMAFFLEYCFAPYRNPAGARFVDCDVVADPSRWGS